MPKEQFREPDIVKKVSHIVFGMNSAEQIQQESHIRVFARNMYSEGRKPAIHGILDERMGISQKLDKCATCKQSLSDCVGHYGYIDLSLPVFHVGHFTAIIQILQSICKSCSRVMLKDEDKKLYNKKLQNPNLSYLAKKSMRAKILKQTKKTTRCFYCDSINGPVKKGPGLLKIQHEPFRGKKDSDRTVTNYLDELRSATVHDRELNQQIGRNGLIQELNPLQVLELFKNIPKSDIPLLGMTAPDASPVNLIITRVFVPPVCIRPSVVSEVKAGTTEDDLTARSAEILMVNDAIAIHMTTGGKVDLILLDWDYLQLNVSLYIHGELSGIPISMKPKRSSRGLVQRLKGKNGRFRGNLSGKRVDFSARTVISPDPNLMINQVGIPEQIAKILTYPERVNKTNIQKMKQFVLNGTSKYPGANYVQHNNNKSSESSKIYLGYGSREKVANDLKLGDIVERHLIDDDIVLFNRQPSLHKMSIMCHRAKVQKQRTFRFNECCCTPYNADFDGDEMNLHLPQTEEARAEALILMSNKANLVTPRNGELLIAATQDFITGAYLVTQKDEFLTKQEASQLVACLICGPDENMIIDLPKPAILKPRQLWTGKQIFSLIFRPNKNDPVKANLVTKGKNYTKNYDLCENDSFVIIRNSEIMCGSMDKSTLGSGTKNSIFYVILRDFGEDYAIKSMWRLSKMTSYFLMNRGFSFGISDVTPSENLICEKSILLDKCYAKCTEYIKELENGTLVCQPGCTAEETLEAVLLKELSSTRELAAKACFRELHSTNSAMVMVKSGAKGSNINVSQMVACVGQQAINGKRVGNGFEDRALPQFEKSSKNPAARGFVENSFFSGLSPTDFFFHTMGGREGLVDTAVKTAQTGYLQRRLVKCLEDLVVQYDGSVRNATGEIVEFTYGGDGLDPVHMETQDKPVNLDRQLMHVRAANPCLDQNPLNGEQIVPTAIRILETNDFKDFNDSNDSNDSKRDFRNACLEKLSTYAETLMLSKHNKKVCVPIERITEGQIQCYLENVRDKYNKSVIEPGTAVGALAAQSIGEPGTQMTLKTFHFAGVASMNITQGVPRIVEIINASKTMETPIISAEIKDNTSMEFARKVKARIEKTTLGEIAAYIETVYCQKNCFLIIKLDLERINLLGLEINPETVKYNICSSKLRVRPNDVQINGPFLKVTPDTDKHQSALNAEIQRLHRVLKNVVVAGIPTVSRAVIAVDDSKQPNTYKLCVEGTGLSSVMSTYGVVGNKTNSNNIWEVYNTLGIEAARSTIITEITNVMEGHGISVDYRHIMLLAGQMTSRGEVLGITRHGLAKIRESVLNLASFEKTAEHLFDAAYYGQTDTICGVSERIILGMPAFIGTGLFKLLHNHQDIKIEPPEPPIFLSYNN